MGYQNVLPAKWERHTTMSTTLAFAFPWGWVEAAGIDAAGFILKNKAVVGLYTSQPCIQVAATRTDDPGAITVLDSLRGAGEFNTGSGPLTSVTPANYWCRFGFGYALSSGAALGTADSSLEVQYTTTGLRIGGATLPLFASVTQNAFAEVTGWLPVRWVSKVKAALIARSITGNFAYRICYRTAATSTSDPGAWSTAFDSQRTAGEACTGDVALTWTTEGYVQFGIQYYLTSTTPGGAVVDAAFSVR